MFGRDRRQERREERREDRTGGAQGTRYQMHQRMLSIGDDYVIKNDRGEHAFKLDGKALRSGGDPAPPRISPAMVVSPYRLLGAQGGGGAGPGGPARG